MGYKVLAPYVTLKVKDRNGGWMLLGFYAGAPVPDDVEPDSLKHHLDDGLIVADDHELADVLAVPAGTPIPGEPPNVPVTEEVSLRGHGLGDRVERVKAALADNDKAARDSGSQLATDETDDAGQPKQLDPKERWLAYRINERVAARPEGQSVDEARQQATADLEGKSKADLVAGR